MQKFIDIFFVAIVPLGILVYLIADKVRDVFRRHNNDYQKVHAEIEGVRQTTELLALKNFSYDVKYDLEEKSYNGRIDGYLSPFVFRRGECILINVNKNRPETFYLAANRGRGLSRVNSVIFALILVSGVVGGLNSLDLIEVSGLGFVAGALFIVLSIIMLYVLIFIQLLPFKHNSIQCIGVISRLEDGIDNDKVKIFIPIVEYEFEGKRYSIKSERFQYDKEGIGKHVSLLVLKANPNIALIISPWDQWKIGFWLVVLIMSVTFFLVWGINGMKT